jgi:hypothetical protein
VGGLAEVVRSPTFSTGVGLVQYGMARQYAERVTDGPPKRHGFLSRIRRTLSNAF